MADIPKGFQLSGRSSRGRKGYLTETPYKHPGMPDIGAVAMFRTNVNQHLHEANMRIAQKVREGKVNDGRTTDATMGPHSLTSGRGAMPFKVLNPSQPQNSVLQFSAHFNKKEFMENITRINESLKGLAIEELTEAVQRARAETEAFIKTMRRQFKSSYRSAEAHPDDVYSKVADSLGFIVKDSDVTRNQFVSVLAGSFDKTDTTQPTGVKGSRGGNIAIMTERGTRATEMKGMPLGGTARIKENLKTR